MPNPIVNPDQIVFGTLTRAGTTVAANVLGRLLSGIIAGDDADALARISEQLQQLSKAIDKVQATIDTFRATYQATEEYVRCEIPLAPVVASIDGDFKRLMSLKPNDVKNAQKMAADDVIERNSNALLIIHEVMMGIFRACPTDRPMHGIAGMATAACTGPGYNPSDPTPLMSAYRQVENYFRGMINVQTQAALLAINGYMANKDENAAEQTRTDLRTYVADECQLFFAMIEELTVAYHHDITLMDMFLGPSEHDPLRAANAFVNLYPPQNVARLWLWSGRGPGFIAAGDGPTGLESGIEFIPHLPCTLETPSPVAFPVAGDLWSTTPAGGDSWHMLRFALGEPPQQRYNAVGRAAWTINSFIAPDRPKHWGAIVDGFDLGPGTCTYFVNVTSLRFYRMDGLIGLPGFGFDDERLWERERHLSGRPFTLEMWVNFAINPEISGTLAMGHYYRDEANNLYSWRLHVRDDGLLAFQAIAFYPGSFPDQFDDLIVSTVNVAFPNNVWRHVAMTTDGQTITLYVDGAPNGTVSYHRMRGPAYLGAWIKPGSAYTKDQLLGLVNEVRVWNRALSNFEINATMHALPRAADGLIAAYTLDRGQYFDRTGISAPAEPMGNVPIGFDRSFSGLPFLP